MSAENLTIYKYRNCFRLYPYYKSKWNKEKHILEGTCPKLDNLYHIFEDCQPFCFSRFTIKIILKNTILTRQFYYDKISLI